MADLIYLLNTLVDKDTKILVPGILDDVAALHPKEKEIYEKIHFDINEYRSSIGAKKLAHNEEKNNILMHRWRYPSLSLHGIEGAFSEPGQKTVIPGKVIGKFSIRIVPNQEPEKIEKIVVDYLEKKWQERGSPNDMKVSIEIRNLFQIKNQLKLLIKIYYRYCFWLLPNLIYITILSVFYIHIIMYLLLSMHFVNKIIFLGFYVSWW